MKIECLKTIKKRDFKENPQNFLTASHLVFLRPFPADRHIATAKSVFFPLTKISVAHVSSHSSSQNVGVCDLFPSSD